MLTPSNRFSFYLLITALLISIIAFIISPHFLLLALSIYTLTTSISFLMLSASKQFSRIPADPCHRYGHDKYMSIGFIISTILFWISPIILVYLFFQGLDFPTKPARLIPASILILSNSVNSFLVLSYLRKEARYFGFPTIRILINSIKHLFVMNIISFLMIISLLILPHLFIEAIWIILGIGSMLYLGYDNLIAGIKPLVDSGLPQDEVNKIESLINQVIRPPLFSSRIQTRITGEKQFLHFRLLVPGNSSLSETTYLKDILKQEIFELYPNMEIVILVEPND